MELLHVVHFLSNVRIPKFFQIGNIHLASFLHDSGNAGVMIFYNIRFVSGLYVH
jgi:hypothetical protein